MKSLRVVTLLPLTPVPFGSAMGRWFYVLIKGLVERGHQVTAIAMASDPHDVAKATEVFSGPEYDLRCYVPQKGEGLYSKWRSVSRPRSYTFAGPAGRDLQGLLAQPFDVLHLESVWAGWSGLAHLDRAVLNVDCLTSLDAKGGLFESSPLLEKARWLRTFSAEKHLLRKFRFIRTLTPRLSAEARRISSRSEVYTVPLGMDTSLYPFRKIARPNSSSLIGLIGSFTWFPTASAGIRLLTRLWPGIKQRIPTARLLIVGRGAEEVLAKFKHLPGVTIRERLVDEGPDTIPFFETIDVLLYAPVRGSGMKVKVLEAFAMGVPVVTTSEGVEGLLAKDGVHAGVCDNDEGLVDRAVLLLQNAELREQQRLHARTLLDSTCGVGSTINGIEEIYREICT